MNSPNGEVRGRGESVPAQEKVLAAARGGQSGAGRPESAAPAPRTQLRCLL